MDHILGMFRAREARLLERLDEKYHTAFAGKAWEDWPEQLPGQPGDDEEEEDDRTIKLGLGDFVFYSVLVSRAAEHGPVAQIVCGTVVLIGLSFTLVLLAVFRKALPALPISIGLGVFFYFSIHFLVEPFVGSLWDHGVIV